jgi:hypothetical protein
MAVDGWLSAIQVLLKSPELSMPLVESSWSPLAPTITIPVGLCESMDCPSTVEPE